MVARSAGTSVPRCVCRVSSAVLRYRRAVVMPADGGRRRRWRRGCGDSGAFISGDHGLYCSSEATGSDTRRRVDNFIAVPLVGPIVPSWPSHPSEGPRAAPPPPPSSTATGDSRRRRGHLAGGHFRHGRASFRVQSTKRANEAMRQTKASRSPVIGLLAAPGSMRVAAGDDPPHRRPVFVTRR